MGGVATPPGRAPMPRWTEPEVENEDRGKRGRTLLFLRGGGFCYFVFQRIRLNSVLLHFILFAL